MSQYSRLFFFSIVMNKIFECGTQKSEKTVHCRVRIRKKAKKLGACLIILSHR